MANKKFKDILDECLERLSRGETPEQCLSAYPEQADELRPLLETALMAKGAAAVSVRPEMKLRFQQQLHASLQSAKPRRRSSFLGWSRQWSTAIAVVLVLVLASGGTVATASSSMPDSPLYPVKRATEQVRLKLSPSDIAKAKLYVKFADQRVAEIAYLAGRNPEKAAEVITQLDATLEKVAVLATVRKPKDVAALAPSPDVEGGRKGVPTPVPAPPPTTAPLTETRKTPQLSRSARDLERAELKQRLVENYQDSPEALREALEKAPNEKARKAILQAIKVSQKGYERALKALEEENESNDSGRPPPQSRLPTPKR